jgi:phage gp36-like protein
MAYCTQTDIEVLVSEEVLLQLTDDADEGSVDETKVADAIEQADALIDGYLRGRYSVPLTTVPTLVMGLSRDIAIYELFSKKGERGVPEEYRLRKDKAEQKLVQIQKGVIGLPVTAPDAKEATPIVVSKTAADRVFTKTLLDGY